MLLILIGFKIKFMEQILIIGDNIIKLVNILKGRDFITITAPNGEIALQQAKFFQPDLILLYIEMPGMDGYEVCKRLKAIGQDIPVIFVSALSESFDKIKLFSVGGIDYITEPFIEQEVLIRIKTHLKLRKYELINEKFHQQHHFLQQVIDSLEHPFYVINVENYQIELANAFMHKLGFQSQITCHALTHKNPVPCNSENDPCPLQQVKLTKKPAVLEHIHFDKKGNPINVEVHGYPIFDENGKVTKMVEYSIDITKRKLAEKKLNEQNKLLNKFTLQLEAAQKEKLYQLNKAYEYFVPHQFLSLLGKKDIIDIQLGDQVEQNMTVLFSDIRDFTSLSETMTPQENFNFINAFLEKMEPIIAAHHGFIDKFIGDAIMALFYNVDDAVQAGIAMLKTLVSYNQDWQKDNYQPIKIGIGINTGQLMLGIIGSKNRKDSTVISDTVNIASRLESLTKFYHTNFLISEASYQNLSNKNNIRLIDCVKVKGKSESIKVFEVFTADSEVIRKHKLVTLEQFEQAVYLYHEQDFIKAQELFISFHHDAIAQVYNQRCQQFLNIDCNTNWKDIAEVIKWTPNLSVNHDLIDQQHQELFIKIKDLIMSIGSDQSKELTVKTIDFLKKYVVIHFNSEEQLMQQHNFTGYSSHKLQHTHFIQRLTKFEEDYNASGGRLYLTLQIQEELVKWLINHINHTDQKLGLFLQDKSN